MALSCARISALARPLFFITLACSAPATLGAQDLPAVLYSTAHGLTHDVLTRVVQDRRGFLWVGGTADIARFDGERFVPYGRAEGLDVGTAVNHFLSAPDGVLWVATNGAGIFRFDLNAVDPDRKLTQFRVGDDRATNRVNVVEIAANGRTWAATDAGVFAGTLEAGLQPVALPTVRGVQADRVSAVGLVARGSAMWVATTHAVYRCADPVDCRVVSARGVRTLTFGPGDRPWLVRSDGIEILADENATSGSGVTIGASWKPRRAVRGSDGMLVITDDRRVIWTDGASERILYAASDVSGVNDILEDTAGNLWMTTNAGLVGIRRQGVTLYSERQLRAPNLGSLSRQPRGRPYALGENDWLHTIDGARVSSAHLVRPPAMGRSLWRDRAVRIDSTGDVWLGTSAGLVRFSHPAFSESTPPEVTPSRVYTTADGLAGNHTGEIFEDSRGDLWIASVPGADDTLTIYRRRTSRFETLGTAFGLPSASLLLNFVEDRHGTVWAALREGGLVRLGAERADVFGVEHGLPVLISALAADRDGGLWIGGNDSVLRIDDATAKHVRVTPILSGLGATVVSLAQMPSGVVFIGTYAGLVTFDPADKSTRRLSSFEGLPRGGVEALVPDSDGTLLLIAGKIVGRLVPSRIVRNGLPPRCLLSALRIGGRAMPVPEAGLEQISGLTVKPSENQIELELLGLSPRLGEPLEYEYRLSGVSGAWTRAPDHRVRLVGLGPDRYTLETRVLGASGTSISPVASVSFRVLPPWYRSWWFSSILAIVIFAAALAAHRNRVAQVTRTERLRARIATDLHDDIGSSLSQIAILAEVARRRAGERAPAIAEPLGSIATTARDLVDSMSDIVWAVNPKTDTLADLTRRMHRFAAETLGAANIALVFSAPQDVDLKLGADVRRELYLILKESVNNIARHSGAALAVVTLTVSRSQLKLVIADNGRGFDSTQQSDGNGLPSMRKRATAFGGQLHIESSTGAGTIVTLKASLRRVPQ